MTQVPADQLDQAQAAPPAEAELADVQPTEPETAAIEPAAEEAVQKRRRSSWLRAGHRTPLPQHFYWRVVLLRFVVNALALGATVALVPQIAFEGNYRIITWLAVSAAFGLLNAFVKPIVQVVMLPLMFVSYGLVVILINAVMLLLLDLVFPARFDTGHLLWVLIGGALFSLISGFLENLLGLTPPIFEGEPEDLRSEIERHKHGRVEKEIHAAAGLARGHGSAAEPAPASEPAAPDAPTQVAEAVTAEVADRSEAATLVPLVAAPAAVTPAKEQAEPPAPVATPEPPVAEAAAKQPIADEPPVVAEAEPQAGDPHDTGWTAEEGDR